MESKEYILCAANHYIFNQDQEGNDFKLVRTDWLKVRGIAPYNIKEGIVLCGWRHSCIIAQMNVVSGLKQHQTTEVQGFLTNKNRFVDRTEALAIAKAAKQVNESKIYSKRLFSEDLY